jgi:SAM-dependent methyltransferase
MSVVNIPVLSRFRGLFVKAGRKSIAAESTLPPDIDYVKEYASADMTRDYWTVTGPNTREAYDKLADEKLQLLIDVGLQPHHKILDVGCGTGQLAQTCEHFLSDDGLFVGTDVGESGIAFCKARFLRKNFQFLVNEPTTLPIRDTRFDVVCFFSVFTHTYPDETVLLMAEAARLLTPNGWLYADAFTSNEPERYSGNRGAIVLNCVHFLRLAAVAGFRNIDAVMTLDWQAGMRREFFRMKWN